MRFAGEKSEPPMTRTRQLVIGGDRSPHHLLDGFVDSFRRWHDKYTTTISTLTSQNTLAIPCWVIEVSSRLLALLPTCLSVIALWTKLFHVRERVLRCSIPVWTKGNLATVASTKNRVCECVWKQRATSRIPARQCIITGRVRINVDTQSISCATSSLSSLHHRSVEVHDRHRRHSHCPTTTVLQSITECANSIR